MSKTENAIVKDPKLKGRWVALDDYDGSNVIGSGATLAEAQQVARDNGYEDPVIVYVPKDDELPNVLVAA